LKTSITKKGAGGVAQVVDCPELKTQYHQKKKKTKHPTNGTINTPYTALTPFGGREV
jgi:hypothetical protein